MSPNCDQIRERLHDQLDDQLDAESVRQVDSHLAECEHCRKVSEALAETRALMSELGPVEAPEGFAADLAAAIRRTPQEQAVRRRSWRSPGPVLASLSMAAAVMFLATISAPYFTESRTQQENLDFAVMEKTTPPRSGALADTEESEAPGIATGDEGDSHLYAKEGGKRARRGDLKRFAETPSEQHNTKKADSTNDDARAGKKASGWGAAKDQLGGSLEKLAKSKNEEQEELEDEFADDMAEGGEAKPNNAPPAPPAVRPSGRPSGGPSGDPAIAPGGRARAERGKAGRQKQDAPSPSPVAPPEKEEAPSADAEVRRPSKKSSTPQEPAERDGGMQRKMKGAAKPSAPKAEVGRVAESKDSKRSNADADAGADRTADKDTAKYRARGAAGGLGAGKGGASAPGSAPRPGGPAGGAAAPGTSEAARRGFAGLRGRAPATHAEETGEVILLVAKVAPDSPEARRLLAYLGANAVPAPAKREGKLAEERPQGNAPATGSTPAPKKPTEAKSKDAGATRKIEQRKALDELDEVVSRLRALQQRQQEKQPADADAQSPAQRGSTIDARLPLTAWKRLNQGVLQTMGLQDLVQVTTERPAPKPKATEPNGPSAPGALPAGRAAAAPIKTVRVLVVFEPAPAPESKGK